MTGWDTGDFGRVIAHDRADRMRVVGAVSGIGRATAEHLAGCGATDTPADRDDGGAKAVALDTRQVGGKATALTLDAVDAQQVADQLARCAGADAGGFAGNAGCRLRVHPAQSVDRRPAGSPSIFPAHASHMKGLHHGRY